MGSECLQFLLSFSFECCFELKNQFPEKADMSIRMKKKKNKKKQHEFMNCRTHNGQILAILLLASVICSHSTLETWKYDLRICKGSALCISSHQLAFSVGALIKRIKIKKQDGLWALSQKPCMTIPPFPHQLLDINFASSSKHCANDALLLSGIPIPLLI